METCEKPDPRQVAVKVLVDVHLLAVRPELTCKRPSAGLSWGCWFCTKLGLSYFSMSLTNASWNWKLFSDGIDIT